MWHAGRRPRKSNRRRGRPRLHGGCRPHSPRSVRSDACAALMTNPGASMSSALSFPRMCERYRSRRRIREAMIATAAAVRLPPRTSHPARRRAERFALVVAPDRNARADHVAQGRLHQGLAEHYRQTSPPKIRALIEHLRVRGDLTATFLIRTIAHGKVDFFGSALVALTGQTENRVRSLLAEGGDGALSAAASGRPDCAKAPTACSSCAR